MALVSVKEMLEKALKGKYAVGQFNINNLEWTKAVLATAEELKSPVILGVSEGAGKYMTGFKTVADMVKAMIVGMNITVPVALHLDHGTYEGCYKCIEAGFSSIMFDGSHFAIEENIAKTKELVSVCNKKGLSIEAEVGSIGGEEDGVVGLGECADPDECKKIADLGVTILAAGIDDYSIGKLRYEGYRQALIDNGIEPASQLVCHMDGDTDNYSIQTGYRLMKKLLNRTQDFTAVYAIADSMAIGACRALAEAGKKIPEDYSVAGFDGLEIGEYYNPSLTTIRQPVEEIAKETVDLLFHIIQKNGGNKQIVLPGELVIRESTKEIKS